MTTEWDFFICHASEDKKDVVDPLAEELRKHGARVWYDRWELRIGDSLRRKIDEGLSSSRYGIVVISQDFFRKEWPQRELDGLVQREVEGRKVILPVWHNVTRKDVASYSPPLADKMAGTTSRGVPALAEELIQAIERQLPDKKGTLTKYQETTTKAPASVQFSYHHLESSEKTHRYSLKASLTLNLPPDQGRFRLRLLWPSEIIISRMHNLREGRQQKMEGRVYREILLDCEQRIFPLETMNIIGPETYANLEYAFDKEIQQHLHRENLELRYTLYMEDHLPVDSSIPFAELSSLC
jgi:hypothetical protein